jgi:predicted DNA-binding protein YlxM (UPF0122 family)
MILSINVLRIRSLNTYKQKGAVISFYVPDDFLLNEIRQKSAQEERSVSQWTYRVIRRALRNENDINNKKPQSAEIPPERSEVTSATSNFFSGDDSAV